jgi:hypothetical protein
VTSRSLRIGIRPGETPPAEVAQFVRSHPGIDVVLRDAGRLTGRRIRQWATLARRAGAARAMAEVGEGGSWAETARGWVDAAAVDVVAVVAADAAWLARVLAQLRGTKSEVQIVWRGAELDLDDLAAAFGTAVLDVVVACASPADAAAFFRRWRSSAHRLARSSLVPACAAPADAVVVPAWPDDRAVAAPAFAAVCASCRLRTGCEGLPAAWEPPNGFEGPASFGLHDPWDARLFAMRLDALAIESLALQAGLRRVWRLDLETPRAELLGAAIAAGRAGEGPFAGAGLHVAMLRSMTLDERDQLEGGGGEVAIVYVSRDPADAKRALAIETGTVVSPALRDAEAGSDALGRELGALLGYPTCCTEAFLEGHHHWRPGHPLAETTFYALRALARSERLDPRLDFTSPLSDACLLRHYVCRFDCPASIALAEALEAVQLARTGRGPSRRSVATLLYPDAGAVALAGEPDGRALRTPRIVPASPGTTRAARSESLAAALAPVLADASVIVDEADGAVLVTGGGRTKLEGAPRLLVFAE